MKPGPHEPAALETDDAMLAQARELRSFLIERAEAEGDTSAGHAAYCYTLKAAVVDLLQAQAIQIGWLTDDKNDAPKLRERIAQLERDLVLAEQPLAAQMQRLNERVIALTAELDRARVAHVSVDNGGTA